MKLLGIDTGGTFTDFILYDDGHLRTHKVLSTPRAPEQAILQGITELELAEPDLSKLDLSNPGLNDFKCNIVHGSTVATNALLEGKGVNTVYITNFGLADLLTIGRQTRKELYNLQTNKAPPPVDPEYCLQTGGRISASGEVLEALTEEHLEILVSQLKQLNPEAVAINLMFSYLDDTAEKRISQVIPENIFVSRSSLVLAEYKEYERGIATWLNSYVGPLVQGYLKRLQSATKSSRISVMQSSGGTIAAEHAGQQAVNMLLSGPAGGLAAAKYMGDLTNLKGLLTFDMGGTSTDVSMIDSELQLTNEGEIAGYPVAVSMVDMHTIGAGGGSIASIDAGGLLQVGPESAGADPGPACYGLTGKNRNLFATVTDANLLLGRLRSEYFLGGSMKLDINAARKAINVLAQKLSLSIEETANGIIRLANEHMAQALRVMSVERGIDPKKLCLVSFGGAGGLHVCALADTLTISRAMVPRYAGVLSAFGMLVAPRARQLSQTVKALLAELDNQEIEKYFLKLYQKGCHDLTAEGISEKTLIAEYSLDCRYSGQSYSLNVEWDGIKKVTENFQILHEKRYGHRLNLPVELVNLRLSLKGKAQEINMPTPSHSGISKKHETLTLAGVDQAVAVYQRDEFYSGQRINGPALIIEPLATTYLQPGWLCEVDVSGCLLLNRRDGTENIH